VGSVSSNGPLTTNSERNMPRIKGITARDGGLGVKMAYLFTRRSLVKLTGRNPERMLEPMEMLAYSPALMNAYGKVEQAAANARKVDRRLSDLAELRAATLVSCEYCIDLGSQVARNRSGLTDEQLLALPRYADSDLFTEVEKVVLDYTTAMCRTPVEVSDELFSRLRQHLDEAQIVELTFLIALGNMRGRFNLTLGIGSAGFSEGMVCALPVKASEPA